MIRYGKLENSVTAALHERDDLQKRFKVNADKKKRARVAKIPRDKILAEGLPFASHGGLQAHISRRYLGDLASTIKRLSMQARVKKLEKESQSLMLI